MEFINLNEIVLSNKTITLYKFHSNINYKVKDLQEMLLKLSPDEKNMPVRKNKLISLILKYKQEISNKQVLKELGEKTCNENSEIIMINDFKNPDNYKIEKTWLNYIEKLLHLNVFNDLFHIKVFHDFNKSLKTMNYYYKRNDIISELIMIIPNEEITFKFMDMLINVVNEADARIEYLESDRRWDHGSCNSYY
jgi:hypothetical protein